MILQFRDSLAAPLWTASCDDADRYLTEQRRAGQAPSTRAGKAGMLAAFYAFVIGRYQGDIHVLTGWVIDQPIDEFNRPASADCPGACPAVG